MKPTKHGVEFIQDSIIAAVRRVEIHIYSSPVSLFPFIVVNANNHIYDFDSDDEETTGWRIISALSQLN